MIQIQWIWLDLELELDVINYYKYYIVPNTYIKLQLKQMYASRTYSHKKRSSIPKSRSQTIATAQLSTSRQLKPNIMIPRGLESTGVA